MSNLGYSDYLINKPHLEIFENIAYSVHLLLTTTSFSGASVDLRKTRKWLGLSGYPIEEYYTSSFLSILILRHTSHREMDVKGD